MPQPPAHALATAVAGKAARQASSASAGTSVELHAAGVLTAEEFAEQKARILA